MSYPTWSDLNREGIVPPLGARKAPDIGPIALLVSPEPDFRMAKSLADPVTTKGFFMGSIHTGMQQDGISIAGPYIGAPYAVMLLESLIAKGARTILVMGWCGALTEDLQAGDLLIPDRACVDEGTSRHYRVLDMDPPVSFPHPGLCRNLKSYLEKRDIPVKRGAIWTTDAIYRETPNKVAWFRDRGALAVEMECSALFSAADYRGVDIAALLVVSDSVASKDWAPAFKAKQFKAARTTACEALIRFGRSLTPHDLNP